MYGVKGLNFNKNLLGWQYFKILLFENMPDYLLIFPSGFLVHWLGRNWKIGILGSGFSLWDKYPRLFHNSFFWELWRISTPNLPWKYQTSLWYQIIFPCASS